MSGHTAGAWRVVYPACNRDNIRFIQDDQRGRIIAMTNRDDDMQDEIEANAQLIAAAPELLEACKKLVAWHDCFYPLRDREHEDDLPIILQARAAIAKAEAK